MSGTPLTDALWSIRKYVEQNDSTGAMSFEINNKGDWLWSYGDSSVKVDFAEDRTGLVATFMDSGTVVAIRSFPLKGHFPIESRIGSQILTHLGLALFGEAGEEQEP